MLETGVTERHLEKAMIAKLFEHMGAIRNALETDNFIIDEWGVILNETVCPVRRVYDGPIIVTSILAVWPVTSTSVTLNLGQPGRSISLPPATGFFNPDDLKIQLGIDDVARNLTIAPAGSAYLNVFGYADRKQVDRYGG